MEFKGLGVLESWNHTRKPWVLKIAILFTKPGVSDLNSMLLREIPATSSRHVWKFSWMYLNSAISLPPSKQAAPVPLNFQRNSHGFLCVCVLKGLPKYCNFGQLTFTGFPKFFWWVGGRDDASWGREKSYTKAGFLRKVVRMVGSKCCTTSPPLPPNENLHKSLCIICKNPFWNLKISKFWALDWDLGNNFCRKGADHLFLSVYLVAFFSPSKMLAWSWAKSQFHSLDLAVFLRVVVVAGVRVRLLLCKGYITVLVCAESEFEVTFAWSLIWTMLIY